MASNKVSIVKRVVAKIREDKHIILFHDQHNDAYISIKGDGTKVYEIGSEDFFDWLDVYVMDVFGDDEALLGQQPKNVSGMLRGIARVRGQEIRLELRTYHEKTADGDVFWYDLGESAVKITKDKWSIVAYPPIIFKRYHDQVRRVAPEKGGDIWTLFDFINVKDPGDRLLIIAFILVSIIPTKANKPILTLSGQAGSGKTECARTIIQLTDPTMPEVLPPPDKTDELDKIALTNAVMAFDNLTSIKAKIANRFCCLATGVGVRIRRLYETLSYIVFNAIRPIIVTGISQTITQSDLLNRAVIIELEPIESYESETKFREDFEQAKPFLLGAIFDLLYKAMEYYPSIPKDKKWPRMSEFCRWGYAITASLGNDYDGEDFMKAWQQVEIRQNEEAMAANPLAQAIIWLMEDKDVWRGAAEQLLSAVTPDHDDHSERAKQLRLLRNAFWPDGARSTSVSLRKIRPNLKSIGIDATIGRKKIVIINTTMPATRIANEWLHEPDFNGIDKRSALDYGRTVLDCPSIDKRYLSEATLQDSQNAQKPQISEKEFISPEYETWLESLPF